MNSPRKLAKGYGLLVGGPGEGAAPWGIWKYDEAPAECFADAEEPVREGDRVVVKVPDGHMGASGEVVAIIETDGGAAIEVLLDGETRHRQYRHSDLRRECPDERPAEKPEPPPVHMSNPDVAGIEASRRLAKVWFYTACRYVWCPAEGGGLDLLLRRDAAAGETLSTFDTWIPAPTLGEMLAEIRRRGWRLVINLEHRSDGEWIYFVTLPRFARGVHGNPADALANALVEALEKEGAAK